MRKRLSTMLRPKPVFVLLGASVTVILVSFWLRAALESRHAFALAEQSEKQGDLDEAILHLRHSALFYAPLGTKSSEAIEKLIALGKTQRKQENLSRALFAYRSARFAVMATRHITMPHKAYLPEIHKSIAALEAKRSGKTAADIQKRLDQYQSRLPNPGFGFAAALVFVLWIASLFITVNRGFGKEGRPKRQLIHWGPICLILLVAWTVFLYHS